jgi:hypothetical protein
MDEQFLRDLYTQVLGREPDPAGFAHNLGLLQSGAISPGEMANAFAGSQEAQTNTIPAAQEQQAAQSVAQSIGFDAGFFTGNGAGIGESPIYTDSAGYPAGWQNVTAQQLQRIGITNPAILQAANEGRLDNPTFGSLNLDARKVAEALNENKQLPSSFIESQATATFKDAPSGKVVAQHLDASGGIKYWYENGGSVVYKDGVPIEVSPAFSAYRKVEGDRNLAVADNPGYTVFEGRIVPVNTNQYQWNPETQSPETIGGVPSGYRAPKSGGFFESIGSSLADFDKSVGETIPGGWGTLAGLTAAIAAPYAYGALSGAGTTGAAAGGAAAGTTAAGTAATGTGLSGLYSSLPSWGQAALKGAAIGSGVGGGVAGLTGGNVGQGILRGGLIGGATGGITQGLSNLSFGAENPLLGSEAFSGYTETGLPTIAGEGFVFPGDEVVTAAEAAQRAAQFPNLYPGGVLPPEGYSTIYTPAGDVAYAPTADLEAYAKASPSLLSTLGNVLSSPLGRLGAMGGLSLLSGGMGGQQQAPIPQMAGGGGTYAPRGQVDYTPILNLLAPKQISRNSLLG